MLVSTEYSRPPSWITRASTRAGTPAQAGPAALSYPALHEQLATVTEPGSDWKLAGHAEQFVLLVAVQGVDGKEPAGQAVQAAHGARPVAL